MSGRATNWISVIAGRTASQLSGGRPAPTESSGRSGDLVLGACVAWAGHEQFPASRRNASEVDLSVSRQRRFGDAPNGT
jgi:hypothetical protein